jgi:hypothetical protein
MVRSNQGSEHVLPIPLQIGVELHHCFVKKYHHGCYGMAHGSAVSCGWRRMEKAKEQRFGIRPLRSQRHSSALL